jgi:hypothetical protein
MPRPADHDLVYYQGDDEHYRFKIRRRSDGTPVDLSTAVVTCQIRTGYADSKPVIASPACTVLDGPEGLFSVDLPAAMTTQLAGKSYRYDIQVSSDGRTRTYIRGSLSGDKEITRP